MGPRRRKRFRFREHDGNRGGGSSLSSSSSLTSARGVPAMPDDLQFDFSEKPSGSAAKRRRRSYDGTTKTPKISNRSSSAEGRQNEDLSGTADSTTGSRGASAEPKERTSPVDATRRSRKRTSVSEGTIVSNAASKDQREHAQESELTSRNPRERTSTSETADRCAGECKNVSDGMSRDPRKSTDASDAASRGSRKRTAALEGKSSGRDLSECSNASDAMPSESRGRTEASDVASGEPTDPAVSTELRDRKPLSDVTTSKNDKLHSHTQRGATLTTNTNAADSFVTVQNVEPSSRQLSGARFSSRKSAALDYLHATRASTSLALSTAKMNEARSRTSDAQDAEDMDTSSSSDDSFATDQEWVLRMPTIDPRKTHSNIVEAYADDEMALELSEKIEGQESKKQIVSPKPSESKKALDAMLRHGPRFEGSDRRNDNELVGMTVSMRRSDSLDASDLTIGGMSILEWQKRQNPMPAEKSCNNTGDESAAVSPRRRKAEFKKEKKSTAGKDPITDRLGVTTDRLGTGSRRSPEKAAGANLSRDRVEASKGREHTDKQISKGRRNEQAFSSQGQPGLTHANASSPSVRTDSGVENPGRSSAAITAEPDMNMEEAPPLGYGSSGLDAFPSSLPDEQGKMVPSLKAPSVPSIGQDNVVSDAPAEGASRRSSNDPPKKQKTSGKTSGNGVKGQVCESSVQDTGQPDISCDKSQDVVSPPSSEKRNGTNSDASELLGASDPDALEQESSSKDGVLLDSGSTKADVERLSCRANPPVSGATTMGSLSHPHQQLETNVVEAGTKRNRQGNTATLRSTTEPVQVKQVREPEEKSRSADSMTVWEVGTGVRSGAWIVFYVDGEKYMHPPLPDGWSLHVSKTKKKPYYSHPDFGVTWYCPNQVVADVPMRPGVVDGMDSEKEYVTANNDAVSSSHSGSLTDAKVSAGNTGLLDIFSNIYKELSSQHEATRAFENGSWDGGSDSPGLCFGSPVANTIATPPPPRKEIALGRRKRLRRRNSKLVSASKRDTKTSPKVLLQSHNGEALLPPRSDPTPPKPESARDSIDAHPEKTEPVSDTLDDAPYGSASEIERNEKDQPGDRSPVSEKNDEGLSPHDKKPPDENEEDLGTQGDTHEPVTTAAEDNISGQGNGEREVPLTKGSPGNAAAGGPSPTKSEISRPDGDYDRVDACTSAEIIHVATLGQVARKGAPSSLPEKSHGTATEPCLLRTNSPSVQVPGVSSPSANAFPVSMKKCSSADHEQFPATGSTAKPQSSSERNDADRSNGSTPESVPRHMELFITPPTRGNIPEDEVTDGDQVTHGDDIPGSDSGGMTPSGFETPVTSTPLFTPRNESNDGSSTQSLPSPTSASKDDRWHTPDTKGCTPPFGSNTAGDGSQPDSKGESSGSDMGETTILAHAARSTAKLGPSPSALASSLPQNVCQSRVEGDSGEPLHYQEYVLSTPGSQMIQEASLAPNRHSSPSSENVFPMETDEAADGGSAGDVDRIEIDDDAVDHRLYDESGFQDRKIDGQQSEDSGRSARPEAKCDSDSRDPGYCGDLSEISSRASQLPPESADSKRSHSMGPSSVACLLPADVKTKKSGPRKHVAADAKLPPTGRGEPPSSVSSISAESSPSNSRFSSRSKAKRSWPNTGLIHVFPTAMDYLQKIGPRPRQGFRIIKWKKRRIPQDLRWKDPSRRR